MCYAKKDIRITAGSQIAIRRFAGSHRELFNVLDKSGFETHRHLALGNLEGNKMTVSLGIQNLTLSRERRHKVYSSSAFPVMPEAVEHANDTIKCMRVSMNTESYLYINKRIRPAPTSTLFV